MKCALALLLGLFAFAGCCVQENPNFVFTPPGVRQDLARACRVSNQDTLTWTVDHAVEAYLSHLIYKPSQARQCVMYPGSICEFNFPCDHPPDMSGKGNTCQTPPPRPRRYVCLGCGRQPTPTPPDAIYLIDDTSALLDRVVRESGARSREEALHQAILYWEQLWLDLKKEPDFRQHSRNLPRLRKPDEPCWGQPPPALIHLLNADAGRQK